MSTTRTIPSLTPARAAEILKSRDQCKLAHNTILFEYVFEMDGPVRYGVALHETTIFSCQRMSERHTRYTLNSGGWQTTTTKQRLNKLLPRDYRVFQKDHAWFLTHLTTGSVVPFTDGMHFLAITNPEYVN